MDMKPLNFEHMKNNSHKNKYFNRYINIICELFDVDFINAFELYNVKTPFDIQINGKTTIEVKVQKKLAIEQYTDDDKKIKGWMEDLEEDVNYILFFFPDTNKYICIDGFLLWNWWITNNEKYEIIRNKVSVKDNNTWVSSYSYVPLEDIPNCIIHSTNIELQTGFDAWM